MFFDGIDNISNIAKKVGTSVFVIPDKVEVRIPGAIVLNPEGKTTITIEQVRSVLQILQKKQISDVFVIIRPADLLNHEAANALLKNLEEPQKHVHFVLVTSMPSKLLSTILSRASVFFLRPSENGQRKIDADEKVMAIAKKLIAARPGDLVGLADEITKKKAGTRQYALNILGVAIEVLYKTYLINQKTVFLKKIPKFLAAYDAINNNGHIKLHLVADLA